MSTKGVIANNFFLWITLMITQIMYAKSQENQHITTMNSQKTYKELELEDYVSSNNF